MAAHDFLACRFPLLSSRLPRAGLGSLPTPVHEYKVRFRSAERTLAIKHDNQTSCIFGGNKVRKLEYILPRAASKGCTRIATFGAAGSNHALATALYARELGLGSTCFLAHQAKAASVGATLNKHIQIGTDLVPFGGDYRARIRTLRDHLWGRRTWVIPMGGSSWLGTIGFVAAGLELAEQLEKRAITPPQYLYVAAGTMGTAVGIALGLALAGAATEVQAVRVSHPSIMNRKALDTLLNKTVLMMHRLDAAVPLALAQRARIRIRNEFFGPGYARGTKATEEAIRFARDALDLELETTYTAKAMSALLADWWAGDADNALYWHTCNSEPLHVPVDRPLDRSALPAEFMRYFES